MKDLFAGLLALIESKRIPAAYKVLVGAAFLALLLKLVGFPVVKYVEDGVKVAFEKASILSHLVVGLFTGSLLGRPIKAFTAAMSRLFVQVFEPTSEQRRAVRQTLSSLLLGIFSWSCLLVDQDFRRVTVSEGEEWKRFSI